jgi:hypothetical protein
VSEEPTGHPAHVTNEDLMRELVRLSVRVAKSEQRQEDQIGETARLRKETDAALEELKTQINAVLEPWKAAKFLGVVGRWVVGTIVMLGAAAAAIAGFFEWFREWLRA